MILVEGSILRFSRFLGTWGGHLCGWSYALERRARRNEPPCPDCRQRECYCEAAADQQRVYSSIDAGAYGEGYDTGYEAAEARYR